MRKNNENKENDGTQKNLKQASFRKKIISNDTSLLIAGENQLITLFNNYKTIRDPDLLSNNLESFINIIKNEFFNKNITITDELYNLLTTEDILKEAKIKYSQEINNKIDAIYSKIEDISSEKEKFNISKEQEVEILQDISFVLFLFGAGKDFNLNKGNLEALYFTDSSEIYTFLKSIINPKIDIKEFLIIIDTVGKIFPTINKEIGVGDRIIGKQFFDKFMIYIYEYEKLILNNNSLNFHEKILSNITEIYKIKDKIIKSYNDSTIHSSIYKATHLSNDILKTINDGIIIIDKTKNAILGANDSFCEIIGIEKEKLKYVINKKVWPIEGFKQINDDIYEYTCNDGTKKFLYFKKIEGNYFLLQDNGYILALTDITERKKAEEERNSILKLSPNGIFVLKVIRDKNNEIINFKYEKCYGNKSICLGEEKDIIGKTIKERFDREISDQIESACKVALENKTNVTLEYQINDRFYELNIGPYYLDDTILIYKTDITDKKNAEKLREKELIAKNVSEKSIILVKIYTEIIKKILGVQDMYSPNHSDFVQKISEKIVQKFNEKYPDEKIDLLETYVAGALHDIGKLTLPRELLNNPSAFTDLDLNYVRLKHVHKEKIYDIVESALSKTGTLSSELGDFFNLENVLHVIIHHHEKLDGTGYPDKIKGDQIPMLTRIITVADMLDAIANTRIYRSNNKGLQEAFKILIEKKGTKLDERIMDIAIELYKEYLDKKKKGEKDKLFSILQYKD